MIEVTRLNGNPMILNSDLIKIAEASPDTMLTLIHGEKLIVRESCAEILEKVLTYRAQLLAEVAARGAMHEMKPDLHRLAGVSSLSPEACSDPDARLAPSIGPGGMGLPGAAAGERHSRTISIESIGR